jgi:hypothetical protein
MPLAEEKLAEKVPFDVYGVMLVLSALFTVGAILMMSSELRENWYGAEQPGSKKAEHLTKLNAQTPEEVTGSGPSPWTQVTDQDKTDYVALGGAELKTPAYPEWMKVNTEGVKFIDKITDVGGFPMDTVPNEERESMKTTYVESDATTGVMEEQPQK